MKHSKTLVLLAGLSILGLGGATPTDECRNWSDKEWLHFLTALQQKETGGQPNDGNGCIGDGGKAYGILQIHECCYIDSKQYDKSLESHEWADCLNSPSLSRQVAKAYLKRYGNDISSPRILARKWNGGGPRGEKKDSTKEYGDKFMKIYEYLD